VLTYLSGNKLAGKVALLLSAIEFAFSFALLRNLAHSDEVVKYSHAWISNPNIQFTIHVMGWACSWYWLTTFLVPVIILSSVSKEVDNAKAFYALVLLMQFALIGVFVAMDGFLYYIFWSSHWYLFILLHYYGERTKTRNSGTQPFSNSSSILWRDRFLCLSLLSIYIPKPVASLFRTCMRSILVPRSNAADAAFFFCFCDQDTDLPISHLAGRYV